MRTLFEAFEKTNRRYRLIQKNDRIVLGLSGGPDSVALFLLLLKLKNKYSLRFSVAHLNHQLISAQSSGHEAFSRKLAKRFGVPFYGKSLDIKRMARRKGLTLEEAGRAERYRFFASIARKTRAKKIATAHTLDDQAETVFMRVARGAGLRGLGGIPVKRSEGQFEIIRPLIRVSKRDILLFLKKTGQPFYQDPSNFKDIYTRNRVRNNLLPWVEKHMNPRIKEGLSDLSEICAETQDLIDALTSKALKKCLLRRSAREIRLDVLKLRRLHPAICSEVISQALALLRDGRGRFGSIHIAAVRGMLVSSEKKTQVHLPGPVTAMRVNGVLRIFDTSGK